MDDAELDRMARASDALREGSLRFCTRCGARVEPYQPSASLGRDEYWDYASFVSLATRISDPDVFVAEFKSNVHVIHELVKNSDAVAITQTVARICEQARRRH